MTLHTRHALYTARAAAGQTDIANIGKSSQRRVCLIIRTLLNFGADIQSSPNTLMALERARRVYFVSVMSE